MTRSLYYCLKLVILRLNDTLAVGDKEDSTVMAVYVYVECYDVKIVLCSPKPLSEFSDGKMLSWIRTSAAVPEQHVEIRIRYQAELSLTHIALSLPSTEKCSKDVGGPSYAYEPAGLQGEVEGC